MIGELPCSQLAPLEYCYALDAALATLGGAPPLLICRASELQAEVEQRLPQLMPAVPRAGLWIEPEAATLEADSATFARALGPGAPLIVIASQPLARTLPERRGWRGAGLGLRPGGIGRLCAVLRAAGFGPIAHHGIHSAAAIGLNALGAQMARRGRPDRADQLHFAARLRYRSSGWQAQFSTVALLVAHKTEVALPHSHTE